MAHRLAELQAPALAFKVTDSHDPQSERVVAKYTASRFGRVELWLSGPLKAARCTTSRDGLGVSEAVHDLTKSDWELVPLASERLEYLRGFAAGAAGKPFDFQAMLGMPAIGVFSSEFVGSALGLAEGLSPQGLYEMSEGL